MGGTEIESLTFSLETLNHLDLSRKGIAFIPDYTFKCCNLVLLRLNSNRLSKVCVDGLVFLRIIDISMNNVSSLSLSRLPVLSVLEMFGNNFRSFADVSGSLSATASSLETLSFQLPGGKLKSDLCDDHQYLYKMKSTLPLLRWLDGELVNTRIGLLSFFQSVRDLEDRLGDASTRAASMSITRTVLYPQVSFPSTNMLTR